LVIVLMAGLARAASLEDVLASELAPAQQTL
jgi:hypothetical protein